MTPTAEVVAVGDELLHGRISDTNGPKIARACEACGLRVRALAVVGDDLDETVAALRLSCARADVVVMTGGLGPTTDDRTREAAARAAGVDLVFDEASWAQIDAFLRRRGRAPSPSNRVQAEFPRGAVPLENRWGTAPGFVLRIGQAAVFALPGVPAEMEAMLAHHVVPRLRELAGPAALVLHELHLIGATEAAIGERIATYLAEGHRPRVGINAHYGTYTVRIAAEAPTGAEARADALRVAAELRALLGDLVVYEGEESPAARVVRLCGERGLTLALAESCTGGLLGARLTDVPGASAALRAGYVVYENAAKERDLGVPASTLAVHGAVSVECARAMAEGARTRARATFGLAITGIAGPEGGSTDKPVGTVCFALAEEARESAAWRLRIPDLGRAFIRERAVHEVLFALVRRLGT